MNEKDAEKAQKAAQKQAKNDALKARYETKMSQINANSERRKAAINADFAAKSEERKAKHDAKMSQIKADSEKRKLENAARTVERNAEFAAKATERKEQSAARMADIKGQSAARAAERDQKIQVIAEVKHARNEAKARILAENLEAYGKEIARESLHFKTIRFFEKGYVSIGSGKPEKLIDVTTYADVSKKSGLGRGIVAVASGGLNLHSTNMRGDINITIVTDVKTHLIHVSPPSENSLSTARKIEATGKGLLARLNAGGPVNSAPTDDLASQLAKLVDLHEAGALTDDEFTSAKAKLLG